jgi:hypothetical protein
MRKAFGASPRKFFAIKQSTCAIYYENIGREFLYGKDARECRQNAVIGKS